MQRDAVVELRDRERVVEIEPAAAAVRRPIDAPVRAGIDDVGIDGVERNRVVIDVDHRADVAERLRAVFRTIE